MATVPPAGDALMAKIKRNAVRIGGVNGVRALSRALCISADDSPKAVPRQVFLANLAEFGIELGPLEQSTLWSWLDRDAEGIVRPTDVMGALRTLPNAQRASLAMRVYNSLPKGRDGAVKLRTLRERFDATQHPQVVRGEIAAGEVRHHFDDCFSDEANPSGQVSMQELQQYFAGLSAVVDSDEQFAAAARGCWALPGFDPDRTRMLCFAGTSATGLSATQTVGQKQRVLLDATLQKARADTIAHHRRCLLETRGGLRALGCALRAADAGRAGFLTRSEFLEAIATVRLYVSHEAVLDAYDVNADGTVDYQWYLFEVAGELPPARKLMVERLWRGYPTAEDGTVEVAFLQKQLQGSTPEALSGFLDAWDIRRASPPGGGPARASFFEFASEWLVPKSLATKKDADFEEMLRSAWGATA